MRERELLTRRRCSAVHCSRLYTHQHTRSPNQAASNRRKSAWPRTRHISRATSQQFDFNFARKLNQADRLRTLGHKVLPESRPISVICVGRLYLAANCPYKTHRIKCRWLAQRSNWDASKMSTLIIPHGTSQQQNRDTHTNICHFLLQSLTLCACRK